MRRWWLLCACLGLLVLTSHVFAIGEAIEDLEDVATIMPADTAFYFVMRTDEQVLEDLNAFVDRVTDKLALFGVGSVNLEDELRRSLEEQSINYDDLRAGVGDFIAMSLTESATDYFMNNPNNTTFPPGARIYIQVRDREIVENFIGGLGTRDEQGSYTLYRINDDIMFALSNQWLILMGDRRVPEVGDSLAGDPDYETIAAKMPGSNYGALMYMTPEVLGMTVEGTPNDLYELTAQHAIFGFALDAEQHLLLDFVQTIPDGNPVVDALPTTAVDPKFLRYVPEDADLLIQLTDVSSYVDYFDAYMESFAPGINVRDLLEDELRTLDLNLEDDLLGWMDGEAVLFSTVDLGTLIEISEDGSFETIPFEFGLVMETSDPEASQRFFDALRKQAASSNTRGLRIGSATVNGVKVTMLNLAIPSGSDLVRYEVMLGVTDEVAFIASSEVAQFITSGSGESLLDNDDYAEAAALYLPNTKQVLYASDDGIVTVAGALAAAVVLGSEFEMPGLPISQAASPYIAYQDSNAFILELVRDIVHSASVTSSLEEGFQTTRMVFSLE